MLTSRRTFEGETVTDTLAKVLEREKLIQNCLKKSVKDRLQAIGDARTQLQEWIATPAALLPAEEHTRQRWSGKILPWALAPVFLAAGWLLRPSPDTPRPARLLLQ
jgi:hypothetical protein